MVFSAGANLYIERERLKLRSEVDKLKGRWMVLEMIRRLCYPDKTPDCDCPTCAPFEQTPPHLYGALNDSTTQSIRLVGPYDGTTRRRSITSCSGPNQPGRCASVGKKPRDALNDTSVPFPWRPVIVVFSYDGRLFAASHLAVSLMNHLRGRVCAGAWMQNSLGRGGLSMAEANSVWTAFPEFVQSQ